MGLTLALAAVVFAAQADAAGGLPRAWTGGTGAAVHELVFSADGRTLLEASGSEVRLRAYPEGVVVARFSSPRALPGSAQVAPDGSRVYLLGPAPHRKLAAYDAATGRETAEFSTDEMRAGAFALAPDGCRLASAHEDGTIRLWDAATGRLLRSTLGDAESTQRMAFSPEGRIVASIQPSRSLVGHRISVWDPETLRRLGSLEIGGWQPGGLVMSQDGARLAAADRTGVRLWKLPAPGDEVRLRVKNAESIAFSPDGRRLAITDGGPVVRGWAVDEGRPAFTIALDGRRAHSTVFSPDGKALVIGLDDGSVVLRDPRPTSPPTAEEMAGAWRRLAGEDPYASFDATWTLASAEQAAVRFVRERLQWVGGEAKEEVLRDFESDDVAARAAAGQALLDDGAFSTLRRLRDSGTSAETRARASDLIDELRLRSIRHPEAMRDQHLVRALEWNGTREAQVLIAQLAERGTPEVAREAAAALTRLRRK